MNKCFFQGRLTADPESSTLANGTRVVKFSLAIRRPAKNTKEAVDFVNCSVWIEPLQEFALKYLHKGEGIIAVASYSPWRNKEGRDVPNFNIVEIEFPMQKPRKTEDNPPFEDD